MDNSWVVWNQKNVYKASKKPKKPYICIQDCLRVKDSKNTSFVIGLFAEFLLYSISEINILNIKQ